MKHVSRTSYCMYCISLQCFFFCGIFRTADEVTEHILHHSSKVSSDSELNTERWPGLNEPETPSDTEHLQQEQSKEKEGDRRYREEERSRREDEKDSEGVERELESRCDQTWENGESEVGIEFKKREKKEEDVELGERRGAEGIENMEVREGVEEDVEKRVRNIDKDKELTPKPTFDSTCSISSYSIQVTEEVMQHSAEALSGAGIPLCSDAQETARKMAALKIKSVLSCAVVIVLF